MVVRLTPVTALLGIATRLGLARLLLITDTRSEQSDLAEFVDAAFAGGVDILQVRDNDADEVALLEALGRAREVALRYQGLVGAFESIELAEDFKADLLHLSERGPAAAVARPHLHEWAVIGRSCHSRAQIDAALADPDVGYLTVGPVYDGFPSAHGGLALVRYAAQVAPPGNPAAKPWFAVGGVTRTNLDEVLAGGARRIAVSRAISDAADPEAAAMALKDRLRRAWNEDPAMQSLTLKLFRS